MKPAVPPGPPLRAELFALLDRVKDPEVPVLSVVELGIVRDIEVTDVGIVVTITPTYSGCPAMREIEEGIRDALTAEGLGPVVIRTVYAPAWTTDWIGAEARAKLAVYGIAPPGDARESGLLALRRRPMVVPCPYCSSSETERRSEFGTTACKSIWWCLDCRQPFEEFKPL